MNTNLICAAHPTDTFTGETAHLLAEASGVPVVCVNPGGGTLDEMVDEIEAERRRRGTSRWTFWGMSGGGWLAQLYAVKHPGALAGIIVESACACFRLRLADPACLISPFNPAWRPALGAAGLIDERSHADVGDPADTEWVEVDGVGSVFRRRGGPALLVAPMPIAQRMRDSMPAMWALDTRHALPSLRVPALIICGSADPVVPVAHARAVHEGISGSRLVVVDGAGHVPVTAGAPEVTTAVRQFLADLPR